MPDLLITIPPKFSPEIKYTFEILMDEFLGQSCEFEMKAEVTDFHISGQGIKPLIIRNIFFNHYLEPTGYLSSTALPRQIVYWTDTSLSLDQLPVLYGQGRLEETTTDLTLCADIIASSYFMLSRWEETVDKNQDQHQRSSASSSTAYRYNYLHRPIVNEYADLLWTLLIRAGYTGERKKHVFETAVTHDVDRQYQWPNVFTGIKELGGDLIKRKNLSLFGNNLVSMFRTLGLNQRDPFDQHNYQMDLAEQNGIRACFNFIVSRSDRNDQPLSTRDPRLKNLIRQIELRGHQIGFHPGYDTYLDYQRFENELNTLQNLADQKIEGGRQHFLRFKVPYTWRLWERAGMVWESSLGYADMPGFRCGSCYSYSVYDCLERKQLSLKEKPLILMDATLVYYLKSWDINEVIKLRNQCVLHGGTWMTIWHNDLVGHPLLHQFKKVIYPQTLD